jgi:hypothetical protein
MLYEEGTASTTAGSQAVVGTGTQWVDNVRAGNLISFNDSGVWYQVASVVNRGQLTLSVPADTTYSGLPYKAVGDFTPVYGFPYPNRYDVDKASAVSRSFAEIDATIFGLNALIDAVEFPPLAVPDLVATPSITSVAIVSATGLFVQDLTVIPEMDYATVNQVALTLSAADMLSTPSMNNVFIGASVKASNNTFTADTNKVTADGALISAGIRSSSGIYTADTDQVTADGALVG